MGGDGLWTKDGEHVAQEYTAGPVAALRRIAFLMERGREETRRVEAFRRAAAVVLPFDPDDVAARAEAGTLTDLPGIGPSTGTVVAEAVRGEVPARLARLEKQYAGPLASGGREVRDALRGDCHSHSDWSDGGSPIEEMAMTAMELGHDYLVLTDHSPRLRVANGLSVERLGRQLEVVEAVNAHLGGAFTLLRGIEVDILDDGSLDQTDEMLARLDLRVASVHSKLRMDADAMTRRMVGAVSNPFTNVLGHPTQQRVRRQGGLHRLRRARRRRRDQLASRAPRPPDPAARAGPRPRLPLLDRQRRPRARSARHARLRLRPRRGGRHRGRPHRQHLAA